jgi:uncharacterized protein YcbK (DUF882 family)
MTLVMPRTVIAAIQSESRRLSFFHTHTGESLSIEYWAQGRHLAGALPEINRVLRDHYSNEVQMTDVKLLDLLHALNRRLDNKNPVHIISGYRSPETNVMLAERGGGVARHSLHLQGKAVDIRIPGRDLSLVRAAALSLQCGGVGFYQKSDFVHLDTGRVRYW